MKIDTSHFVRAHGRAPRGAGTWAFCTVNPDRADYLKHLIWANGLYAMARKSAIEAAKKRGGIETLYVCS